MLVSYFAPSVYFMIFSNATPLSICVCHETRDTEKDLKTDLDKGVEANMAEKNKSIKSVFEGSNFLILLVVNRSYMYRLSGYSQFMSTWTVASSGCVLLLL
jgi:hypothetical protein